MGSAQSTLTPEAILTAAVVVGGAAAIGYTALAPSSGSGSTSREPKAAKGASGKKSKRKSAAATLAVPGGFPVVETAEPESTSAPAAPKSSKSKSKSKPKTKAKATESEPAASGITASVSSSLGVSPSPSPDTTTMSASFCTSCQMNRDNLKACSRCSTVRYCSKECQTEHWKTHKPMCRQLQPDEVWGIQLLCNRELAALPPSSEPDIARRIKHILLKKNHPVFSRGDLCPATQAYGFPLLIFSDGMHLGRQSEGSGNQPAVYLRIEVEDGLAPPNWQALDPDTCIIVRRDSKPLTREAIEACYAFHSMLLSDAWGYPEEDGWAPFQEHITRAAFQLFYRNYYQDQHTLGRKQFKEVFRSL